MATGRISALQNRCYAPIFRRSLVVGILPGSEVTLFELTAYTDVRNSSTHGFDQIVDLHILSF